MPVSFSLNEYLYEHKISNEPKLANEETAKFLPHLHLVHEIIYFISGKTKLITEGKTYIPKAGDIIFIPAKHYHVTEILEEEKYERIVLNIPATPFNEDLLRHAFDNTNVINTNKHPEIPQFFTRVENYYSRFEARHFESLIGGFFNEFLLLCSDKTLPTKAHLAPSDKILDDALHYLNTNLATIENVEEIANHLFVSSSYIYQLFQKKLHISPKKLLATKRLALAQSYILSGEAPYEVYRKCGYKDYSTFYRSYKAHYGHAPSKNE